MYPFLPAAGFGPEFGSRHNLRLRFLLLYSVSETIDHSLFTIPTEPQKGAPASRLTIFGWLSRPSKTWSQESGSNFFPVKTHSIISVSAYWAFWHQATVF